MLVREHVEHAFDREPPDPNNPATPNRYPLMVTPHTYIKE